jgi:peptidyl-prolyl cis-trans isomerase B (cyclophilin B)
MTRTLSHALCTLACMAGLVLAVGCGTGDAPQAVADIEPEQAFSWPESTRQVVAMEVEGQGVLRIALYPELAPMTVAQFMKRAREDYYAGTTFHRVKPDFMIQGGDPNTRDGDPQNDGHGGHDIPIQDEFNPAPHQRGALSLANGGRPNSGGSQFFIVQTDASHLNGKHTVFGRVLEGIEIVDAIAAAETDLHGRWGPRDRPIENQTVARITPIADEIAPKDDHAEAH